MTELSNQTELDRLQLATSAGQFLSKYPEGAADRDAFEDLARTLVADASALVRAALAKEIRSSPGLPVDIAEKIARDIEDIAVPFIELSPVLSEEFLAELVEECSEAARSAVAGRPQVSKLVSFSIARHGGEPSVARLLGNQGAVCSSNVYQRALERFEDCEAVQNGLLSRSNLTLMIIDKLVEKISADASEKLVRKYGLASDLAGYLRDQARREALHKAMHSASAAEVDAYLRRQHDKGNISPDLLSKFLEADLPELFRKALALSAGETPDAVEDFLDSGPSGLELVLNKTGFDKDTFPMIVASFVEYYSNGSSGGATRH